METENGALAGCAVIGVIGTAVIVTIGIVGYQVKQLLKQMPGKPHTNTHIAQPAESIPEQPKPVVNTIDDGTHQVHDNIWWVYEGEPE